MPRKATILRGTVRVKKKGTHGGAREGSGRKTLFPHKIRKPVSVALTKDGRRILRDTVKRMSLSASDVVEKLLRECAPAMTDANSPVHLESES